MQIHSFTQSLIWDFKACIYITHILCCHGSIVIRGHLTERDGIRRLNRFRGTKRLRGDNEIFFFFERPGWNTVLYYTIISGMLKKRWMIQRAGEASFN